ncbi:hypothetical protein DCAR_0520156 [Daucus carota subsp. sativus]|uniref:Chalcone-flavonone isomerase family protein n=1 Tax=Daucus carota subsp. sativus TaxID=79200 RepID=A0AAF0X6P5_DAUCS|nr:PREDICTED: fatty-acid-binding protein 3, chloroplastic [Daucus carota subsp. sativus]WOH00781.1 hypothetical protein DCAR_0520156 [Daucus carota subsp. sativus]
MLVTGVLTPLWLPPPIKSNATKTTNPFQACIKPSKFYHSTCLSLKATAASASASSVGDTDLTEEPATKVKFQTSLSLPGCSSTLSLLGTGYREKRFAIVGVKVYAAGLYVDLSILDKLDAMKGKLDASLFDLIFQVPLEKSLQIVLVRDVDGKTFWDALDDAITPRIKSPTTIDESALSTFRSTFEKRALKKGTSIFLTWLNPTKMLVSVSTEGMPSGTDATIESSNVTLALFDVFFGGEPVSPSLKASVANGLATALK